MTNDVLNGSPRFDQLETIAGIDFAGGKLRWHKAGTLKILVSSAVRPRRSKPQMVCVREFGSSLLLAPKRILQLCGNWRQDPETCWTSSRREETLVRSCRSRGWTPDAHSESVEFKFVNRYEQSLWIQNRIAREFHNIFKTPLFHSQPMRLLMRP